MDTTTIAEETAPELTVIIPVYNAVQTLRPCLESIFANRGVQLEVVVIDDCSTDRSAEIALEFPCRVVSMKSNVMSANCRNIGAKLARGSILVFFDADQVMQPDMLSKFMNVLNAEPDVAAVVGSYEADTPMTGFFSKIKNLRHHYVHQTAQREGATLHSGLTAIRKSVFDEQGGYEPSFGPASIEDIALGYKMRRNNHRIWFCGDIQASHLKGYTLWQLVRSDIVDRAIPWAGLMIRERVWRSDLNTSGGNVSSVALSALMPIAPVVLGLRWGGLATVLLICLIAVANKGLVQAAMRHFGFVFACKSVLFLPFMYFYQGVGLLAGIIAYLLGKSVAVRREAPPAQYEVLTR